MDMNLTQNAKHPSSFIYFTKLHSDCFTAEAQKFAKRQQLETEKRMVQLQETKFNSTWTDVEFLKTANEQLVECRRVLKFTYTFAYYLTMPPKASLSNNNGDDKSKKSKKEKKQEAEEANASEEPSKEQNMQKVRFEHHQEMLERFTENLSELVEKPLKEIDRVMVVNQTRVVDRFMKNMLQYVDDGMEEEDF
jgi:ariadne-1